MLQICSQKHLMEVNCVNMQRIIHKGWLKWNAKAAKDGIGVKTGNSRVNAAGHYLVLLENADFAVIVDFLNAKPIRYALTVSPTIYVSCIEQFWSTAKTKIVNNETQIHAKVEGKTIVISESSVRRDLQFDDEDEVNAVYDTPSHTKKIFANMRRQGKDFSGTVTPLFSSMLAQQADMGEGSGQPTDPQHTSTSAQPSNEEPITVPSSSQPKKTHRPRKAKRATEISQSSGPISLVADETVTKEREDRMERAATTASSLEAEQDSGNINRTQSMATLNEPSPQGTGSGSGPRCQDTILGDAEAQTRFETASKQSNDPPLSRVNTLGSGEDRLKLKELMDLCTKLSYRVLDLETTKTAQPKEIASLKESQKAGKEKEVKNSRDEFIQDCDTADEVPTGDAVNTAGTEVNTTSAPFTTAGVSVSTAEPITTASANITTAEPITPPTITTITIFVDEYLIIAQTLMKMRSEKSKGNMVEQEKPLKKKDQIKFDEKIAQRLQAQMQAELEEEERLAREREEDANIAEWDNVQAMMDADYELAARL
ncbi:hypothetical protein Tco_0815539 [Tanacetum coccineum]